MSDREAGKKKGSRNTFNRCSRAFFQAAVRKIFGTFRFYCSPGQKVTFRFAFSAHFVLPIINSHYFTADEWKKGIMEFRFSGKYRCFGYAEGGIFYLLMIDLGHVLGDR